MIRKPTDKDFAESELVKTMRETRTIAVEGSKGVTKGLQRLLVLWFGGVMIFGFVVSAIPYLGFGILPIAGFAFWYWRDRKRRAAARVEAIERVAVDDAWRRDRLPMHRPGEEAEYEDAAFPDEVRREGRIEADIGAVVQQAVAFFAIGFLCMFMLGAVLDSGAILAGIVCVVLAVLIAARVVGDRAVLSWDTRKVKVAHLLSEGEMQWSDVTDVRVEKASIFNLRVFFQTGSRKNIVFDAPVNRLGGPTEMRVPIRFLGLEKPDLEALLRDLFCWRALGQSVAPGARTAPRPAGRDPVHRPTPTSDPRESFDADAIMDNYLRQREETIRGAGRADDHLAPQRPVFGRKRV